MVSPRLTRSGGQRRPTATDGRSNCDIRHPLSLTYCTASGRSTSAARQQRSRENRPPGRSLAARHDGTAPIAPRAPSGCARLRFRQWQRGGPSNSSSNLALRLTGAGVLLIGCRRAMGGGIAGLWDGVEFSYSGQRGITALAHSLLICRNSSHFARYGGDDWFSMRNATAKVVGNKWKVVRTLVSLGENDT